MLARDGQVVAGDAPKVTFEGEDVHTTKCSSTLSQNVNWPLLFADR
jgi:hypothetical protein